MIKRKIENKVARDTLFFEPLFASEEEQTEEGGKLIC